MRIAIDASSMPPNIAGAGRYICGLIRGLAQADKTNEYFVFLKRRDLPLFNDLNGNFHLVALPDFTRPARVAWEINQPRKLVQRYKLDIWHGPHYILPRALQDVYKVVTFHDLTFFQRPEFYGPLKKVFFQRMIRYAEKNADQIVAVSQTTADDIQCLFGTGYDRLTRVYSGTNGAFRPQTDPDVLAAIRRRFNTGPNYILFVGTLDKRKNLAVLLDAFAALKHSAFADFKLVIAGQKANAYAEVRDKITALGLTNRVVVTDYCPEGDLPALYSAASLVAYPSHYEGFGFPVLEAMACGTPVLTTDVSATKEISGWQEILLQPDDHAVWRDRIIQVLSDKALQARMIRYGLERAKRYSWKETALQMIEIYSQARSRQVTRPVLPANRVHEVSVDTMKHVIRKPEHFPELPAIPRAILYTVVYYDLFDYPLESHELYSGLLAASAGPFEFRSGMHEPALQRYLDASLGFHFLRGQRHLIELRKQRTRISRAILVKNRRTLRFVGHFPFVRGVALSGATAFLNCTADDDIDLFLIVDGKRIWSVYFLLALCLKFVKKRKTICLNYLFGKRVFTLANKGFYAAHQIANLRPLYGTECCEKFVAANRWVLDYLPQSEKPLDSTLHDILDLKPGRPSLILKAALEKIFGLSLFDRIEGVIFKVYSGHIRKIAQGRNGAVLLEKDEIRLFTNDHRDSILKRFQHRLSQLSRAKTTPNLTKELDRR